jgi:hypothetical protein
MTTVITRARGAGKTTESAEWLREDPSRLLLVGLEQHAKDFRRRYPDLKDRVVTLQEWRYVGREFVHTPLGVDNADLVLADMLQHAVDLMTVTGEAR